MAEKLVQIRNATRDLVLVNNGVNGQPVSKTILPVVRVEVTERDTQFLQKKNAPEIGQRNATLIHVLLSQMQAPWETAMKLNVLRQEQAPWGQWWWF